MGAFSVLSQGDLLFYQIADPRGQVVAGVDDLTVKLDDEALRQGVVFADAVYLGHPIRLAATGRQVDIGWVRVVFAHTTTARDGLILDLTLKALGMILVISMLALGAIMVSVRFVLAPLSRLEREITERGPEDLAPIQSHAPVEVAALITAIDSFMARLAKRIALMQRFIADAAHQIRTPLAIVDAEIGMIAAADHQDGMRERLDRLRGRLHDLSRLASQLLSHAMIIHRRDTSALAPVEMVGLARAVLAHAVPLSLEREVGVAFSADRSEIWISGDALSLREALANLLHNAISHGAPGHLAVRARIEGNHACIDVEDDGPGIPEAERAELLEPFRTGSGSSGSGLGLAIVRDVIASHNGVLSFSQSSDGFCVGMQFPTIREA